MKNRVICLLVIGDKYQKQYEKLKHVFSDYAIKCDADLCVVREPLDPTFHRPLLSQKLLVPSQFLDYEIGLFLDLDIIISNHTPSIFEYLPKDKSFGAILDPRHTSKFNETWKHIPRILEESTCDYFTDRNFEYNENLQGSINGGVFIFRPKEVAILFSDYYYSDHNQGELNSFEETPMAYITQINNLFESIDLRFNTQILYELKGTEEGKKILETEKKIPKFIRKYYYKKTKNIFYPTKAYKRFIKDKLNESYFLHFAGSFPVIY